MVLTEAKEKFIRNRKLQGLSAKTVLNYVEVLDRFIKFVGDLDISELNLEIIERYQMYLINSKLANASVANYLRHIKAFINYLIEYDLYSDKTLPKRIKLPKAGKRVVDLFTPEDIRYIFESIDICPEWLCLRNKLIIALMYDSGLRQNEVCNLMYSDINFEQGIVLVHGKGNKERFVPLGNMSLEFLRRYSDKCPYSKDYVFCSKDGTRLSNNAIKKFIRQLRLDTGYKNFTSHKLRHNFATNYVIDSYKKTGHCDIYKLSALLGHEDIETTRIYLHVAEKILATSGFDSHLDSILL